MAKVGTKPRLSGFVDLASHEETWIDRWDRPANSFWNGGVAGVWRVCDWRLLMVRMVGDRLGAIAESKRFCSRGWQPRSQWSAGRCKVRDWVLVKAVMARKALVAWAMTSGGGCQ